MYILRVLPIEDIAEDYANTKPGKWDESDKVSTKNKHYLNILAHTYLHSTVSNYEFQRSIDIRCVHQKR